MSTTEQEMDEALDALEDEHGSLDHQEDETNLEAQNLEEEQIIEDEPKKKPPGFLSYDEWVAKGKDPADFRGENAYSAQYEALKEVRELKDTMTHVVDGMETWKTQQEELNSQEIEQARADAVRELEQATEEDDTGAALAAQAKIHGLDTQAKAQTTQVINPVFSEFARKNPIIDTNSTQYDADFHQDMIMIHNSKLDQLLGGNRSREGELTQDQIERVQALAFSQAKELHADKFVSPKNRRQTTPQSRQRKTDNKGDTKARLKTVEGNSRNPRDTNAADDLYEIIKAKDPEMAEKFAKNVTGE